MSSNQLHVAEKLDLLDPDTPWRKELKIVVDKFTELLPFIRRLLFRDGDPADRKVLPERFLQLSGGLDAIVQQLETALEQLRQRKAEWESAIQSRTGDLDRLDRQAHKLFEEQLRATKELESTQNKNDLESQALRPLQLQVSNAEAELHRAQEEDDSIRQSRAEEERRLHELETGLDDQEQSLIQREEEHMERSQLFDDFQKAKEKDLEDGKLAMERAQAKHKEVLQQLQFREIAVARTEGEQSKAKTSLEKISLDMRYAYSVLKSLANVTETGLDPSVASSKELVDAVSERYSNMEEAGRTIQQTLDQTVQRNSGLEAELDSTMRTLRDKNDLHTAQMKGYEDYKRRVFSLESKVSELEKLHPLVNQLQLECARLQDDNGTLSLLKEASDEQLAEGRASQAKQEQELKKQLNHKAKAITDLNRKLGDRDAKFGTFQNLTRDLEKRIQELETQLTTSQEDARRLEGALRSDINTLQLEADVCKNDYQTLLEDRDRIVKSHDTLGNNLAQAMRINDKVTRSNKALSHESTDLKKQLANAQQSCIAKDSEIAKLTENIQQTQSETSEQLTSLQKTLKKRSRELEDSRSRFLQLEASHDKCADMNAEVEALRTQRDALQSAAQTDKVRSQNNLDSQTQIVADKNDEIKRLENDLRSKEKMCQSLSKQSDKMKELFGALGGVPADRGGPEVNLDGLEQEMADFASSKDREINDLKQKLQTSNQISIQKEKEVSQLNTTLGELRATQLSQANNNSVMERELLAKDEAVKTLQHQLTQAQAQIGRFTRPRIEGNISGLSNSRGSEAQQQEQTSGAQNSRLGDMATNSSANQQVPGPRKRKFGETTSDSNTEQSHRPAPSSNQQDPSALSGSNWAIRDLRDPTYVPDPPLIPAVLSRLRARIRDWDQRKGDWTKPRVGRRCVETATSKKASVWPHGEAFQCEYCKKHKELCVVVEKGGMLTLLPTYQGG